MAPDGDLSLWRRSTKIWSAKTSSDGYSVDNNEYYDSTVTIQQTDGNLVVRSYYKNKDVVNNGDEEKVEELNKVLWASDTRNGMDAILRIDDDGRARTVTTDGKVIWSTTNNNKKSTK